MLKSSERWFEVAGVALMSVVAAAGFAITIYAAWLFHDMPNGSELADFRPVNSARVFAWDGTLIGEYGQERRINVPYDRIPERLRHAFLAAEDRSFFQHSGVDVSGLTRAMLKNVYNLIAGRRFEGGSTITQQVAKNLLLGNERTLGRKLKEVILARRLETSLTKEQILELYLNDIYLGYRSYGIGAAAFNYFGKSVDELTLAEVAYLAALPKGPENYRPSTHKAAAIIRRNWVIGEMQQTGWVTREEAAAAQQDDLIVQSKPRRAHYNDADYFVSEVELRAKKLFTDPNAIYTEGYYLKTTLDPKLQTMARQALMNGLETYDRRHGWRGAWGNEAVASRWQSIAADKEPPSERPNWVQAIVTQATKGSVAVETLAGVRGSLAASDVGWAFAGKGLKSGDLIFVEAAPNGAATGWRLRQVPNVNGALVAIDPFTGRTLAMVGGYSYSVSKFNRATQANRQPGSSIKPFVYAVALERDFTPASIVEDGPISMMGGDGKMWSPENYEHDHLGPQPIRRGIELSRNLMTVRLAQKVGIRPITQKIVEYGISDKVAPEMSMVLGAGEVTPFRLTGAYSIFVNGGRKVRPHLIDQVLDRDGKVVYKSDDRNCTECIMPFNGPSPRLSAPGQQVMDPIAAYQVNSFLQGVVERGTARSAAALGIPMGGKTGTTNDYRSAWFVGFTADLVVGVFVGFDDNRTLGDKETGSAAALPIWVDFMRNANAGKPKRDFMKPRDAVFASIRGREEAFKPGTEPKYEASSTDDGPRPYLETWTAGEIDESPPVVATPDEAPPPKKKTLEDATQLY